jgi:transglutaminase-like putative cysteine protease
MTPRIRYTRHHLALQHPGGRRGNVVEIRLTPRSLRDQRRLGFRLRVDPSPTRIRGGVDFAGNRVCRLQFADGVDRIECHAEAWIQPGLESSMLPVLSPPWESVVELFSGVVAPRWTEVQQYLFASPWVRPSTRWADYARTSFIQGIPLLLGALDLVRRVARDFLHQPGLDGLPTPLEGVWRDRTGGREDLAHVVLACLRSVGLPARMVSGYRATDGSGNAYGTWASVFCPGTGWFALDPRTGTGLEQRPVILNQGRDLTEAGLADWPPHLVACDTAIVEEVEDMPPLTSHSGLTPTIHWETEEAYPWQRERSLELQHPPG